MTTKNTIYDEVAFLKEEIAKLEKYKEFENTAGELAIIFKAFEDYGFSREETMQIVLATIKK